MRQRGVVHWSKDIINKARNKGLKIHDLPKHYAVKKNVLSILAKHKPKLVIVNGHGDIDCVCGDKDEIIFSVNDKKGLNLLKSKIIYARSCHSGILLGPTLVKNGTTAYVGYKAPFVFPFDKNKTSNPLTDKLAKYCLDPSNAVAISLVKGNSVGEAHEKSQKNFQKMINKLANSESSEEEMACMPLILWNKENQILIGDPEATVY